MTDINRMRELAGKATLGKRESWSSIYEGMKAAVVLPGCDPLVTIAEVRSNYADAEFISACDPEYVTALLDRLERAEKALTEERDGAFEADAWTQIVETYSLDTFDELASIWASREPIQRMNNALVSVFTKWANDDLMGRFKDQMDTIIRQAFVEGCIVGVRATEAKAARDQEPT